MAVTFNIQFRISVATKVIRLTDTSTGFTYNKGCFYISFPDGSVRNLPSFTNPDLTVAGTFIDIPCVTDIKGNVITGTYNITYAANDNLLVEQTPLARSFDFNWAEPTNGLTNLSDVVIPEVVFSDITSYSPIGSFTGTLVRTLSSAFPTTSEVSAQAAITSTSSNTIRVVYATNYYEGVYTPTSNVSVTYTHSSNAWLTILYTRTFSATFSVKKCPNQLELVTKINNYRVIIDAYKETNDTQFNILSEQYDLVISLYSHLIARYETATQDGSEPILRELLSILEPYTGTYTYQATKMLQFEIATSTTNSFSVSDGTNTDIVPIGSTLTFASGNVSLVPIVTNNVVTYAPTFGTALNTFAQGNDTRFHTPVTIGTANGLSISTQALSLAAATSGSPGSMSAADKGKLDGIASGATSNVGTVTSVSVTAPAAFSVTGSPITVAGTIGIAAAGTSAQYITGAGALATLNTANVPEFTNLYYTDARARASVSLTTTGTSGASTYSSITGVLNIPNYAVGVASFNTRVGAVVLSSTDVTTALGYVPYNASNPSSYITLISLSSTALGLTYTNTTGVFSLTAGYSIPNSGSTTAWDTAYTNRITSVTSPLSTAANVLSISQASGTVNGFVTLTDWTTFNNKQVAGNYITALTGEVTASGPGSVAATLLNSAVISKVLTGLNLVGGGSITDADTILQAFGKTQNQISALVGGVFYKGVWNASTNTPTIVSLTGAKGNYYVVNVAGATSIDGITDWKVGDWIIFNGTAWDKVDNTDAVSSVNGFLGAVSLTTANIPEVTNLYYTDVRVRASLSFVAGSGGYNSTTGVITIPTNNNQITNGSAYIALTGLSAGAGISYSNTTGVITSTITQYTDALARASVSLTTTGTSGAATYSNLTGVFNIPQYQAVLTNPVTGTGTLNELAYWASASTIGTLAVLTYPSLTEISYVKGVTSAIQPQINTKQSTITLTTTGTSGAATFLSNVLNIPNYGSALSGYLPLTGGTLTGALAGTSATFSSGITFGANNRGFIREPAGDIEIGGSTGAALKLYANNVEYAKLAPSTGFTTTLPFGGTSATFSGALSGTSLNLSSFARFGGWNISTPFGVNAGANTSIYISELDATTVELSAVNNTNTSARILKIQSPGGGTVVGGTLSCTGAATFSSSVTATSATFSNILKVTGSGTPTGPGPEIDYIGGVSYFRSYNRTTSVYLPLIMAGLSAIIETNGTTALSIASTGAATFSSSVTAGGNIDITINAYLGGLLRISRALVDPATTGSADPNYFSRYLDSAGSRTLDIGVSNSGAWLQSRDKNSYAVNYPLLLQPNGGNVLIGTTTDNGSKLQVSGAATFSGALSGTSATFSSSVTATTYAVSGTTGAVFTSSAATTGAIYGYINNASGRFYFGSESSTGGTITTGSTAYYGQIAGQGLQISANTGNNVHVTITPAGNVGIGTSSPGGLLHVKGSGNYDGKVILDNSTTTGGGSLLIYQNGVSSGFLSTKGSALGNTNRDFAFYVETGLGIYTYTNGGTAGPYVAAGGTSWTSSSDERLKDIKNIIPNAIESILKLRAVVHTWKCDNENKEHLGLLAQDLQKVYPQVVVEDDDEIKTLGVNYTELIPVLVKAIQELSAKVTLLENK